MTCPTCGKPVDALRAPAVRVAAGKVVPFCSQACASVWESKPVAAATVPSTPQPAQPKQPRAQEPKDVDSGPVIEIVHEPASGVVTSTSDARTGPVRPTSRAETDGAIQIADTGHIDDFVSYDEPLHKSRALLWVIGVLVVLGGAAAVAYSLGYFDRYLDRKPASGPAPTTTKVTTVEADAVPEPVAIDAAAPITPELALDRARTALRAQLKSNSPRVQRMAAMALARTQDAEARDALATALASETNDTTKIDLAYALARGNDPRGTQALLALLGKARAATDRRDPRLEVGTRLARLGDKRAVAVLESYLDVTQNRLGVAEVLAPLGEPKALKALDQVRADDKSAPDEKARATIALGLAGKQDVAPALREMLPDARQNFFASVALAGLHDEAARPVLVKELDIPSLRVQAARALRRLAPDAKVTDLLPPLLAGLDSNKDTEQVQIAEAILLLAGPVAWSEHE